MQDHARDDHGERGPGGHAVADGRAVAGQEVTGECGQHAQHKAGDRHDLAERGLCPGHVACGDDQQAIDRQREDHRSDYVVGVLVGDLSDVPVAHVQGYTSHDERWGSM